MSQYFTIHADNPQGRLIHQACEIIRQGGVAVYPTDSAYAIGCQMGNKQALETIRRIRGLEKEHLFSLVCRDLSHLGSYAQVDNQAYRLLKTLTPGPYTFILPATKEVPRRLLHQKRKTIGLRVPAHRVTSALLEELQEPLISTTLELPGESLPLNDPEEMAQRLGKQVDLIIDSGSCGFELTTVIDLASPQPACLRQGKGEVDGFF